jgi:catechol 2,3-dioxygenase-like lactoylglutathione lyase family enzyme
MIKLEILGLDNVALYVKDMPRAIEFYRKMLGLIPRDPDIKPAECYSYWLHCGKGSFINLCKCTTLSKKPSGAHATPQVCLNVTPEGLLAITKRLHSSGFHVRLACYEEGTSIHFSDTDGNLIELSCWNMLDIEERKDHHIALESIIHAAETAKA